MSHTDCVCIGNIPVDVKDNLYGWFYVVSVGCDKYAAVHNLACKSCFTLDRTGSLAISLMMGGASKGFPWLSRHRQLAKSNLKPSTWYSSTHLL